MKRILAILISLPILCWGQGNLVPNGSFEELTECPWSINQITLAGPWKNTGGDDTPDLYNVCAIPNQFPPYNNSAGVPQNATGVQYPHSGEGYCGLFAMSDPEQYPNSREYIQVKLLDTIVQHQNYLVTFHISLADRFQYALGSIGALFSDSMITRESLQVLDVEPQVQSPVGVIYDDKDNWMEVRDTFYSRFGGESWIVIGNFLSDTLSLITFVDSGAGYNYDRSYYYIDDVSVVVLEDTVSGIEEAEQLQFNVYPNPSIGRFEVRASEPLRQEATLIVYDTQGRAVLQQQMQKGMRNATLNMEHLAKGIYTLRLWSDDGSSGWEKVVVQ